MWRGGPESCKCIFCSKEFLNPTPKYRKRKFCGHSCKAKYYYEQNKASLIRKGETNNNWRGGITTESQLLRKSPAYREWRGAVFERDNYTCVECGDNRGRNLNADHIKPWSFFPDLRFDVDNGRTLCVPCHQKTETFGTWKQYAKREGLI